MTGLMWAGRKGQIEIAKALIAWGADLEAKDRSGRTALFHGIAYKRQEFVQFMVGEGALLTHVDVHGWTALDLATVPPNPAIMDLLDNIGARREFTRRRFEESAR